MKKNHTISICLALLAIALISFRSNGRSDYQDHYLSRLATLTSAQEALLTTINASNPDRPEDKEKIRLQIALARTAMKGMDVWLRYLQPQAYRSINGPLPVEWETEVFEKFEQPYKRQGAGLTLAALYLNEDHVDRDSLAALIRTSLSATAVFAADSTTRELATYHHFYLCNRLLLLNLAAIYTTGFECPDTKLVIPELRNMLADINNTYAAFNNSFPATPFTRQYLDLFNDMIAFTNRQPNDNTTFDHYHFIRDYVNPLYTLNQQLIARYQVVSHSMVDYSLNKRAVSIFDKELYNGQNAKGIYIRVADDSALALVEQVGRKLFFDPILSGNNQRSCASCHKPDQYFTDTAFATSLQYNNTDRLPRNTPTLLNSTYNHLVMLDGKHGNLQDQTRAVIANPAEMSCNEKEVVKKVLSCKEYKQAFSKLLTYTPVEKEVTYDHIVSAITYYYSRFSKYTAPFDNAMNKHGELSASEQRGFNIFMSKAQCATCHFVPQFNGVKPPYIGSEFEVIGTPANTAYSSLSTDKGRYLVNPATETLNAFRTGTIRNAQHTMPYMHNGVFRTMEEVIDFYDAGGGAGHGLIIPNQTLSADSLHLTPTDKQDLIAFIASLNENVPTEQTPRTLPVSKTRSLNGRKPGGIY